MIYWVRANRVARGCHPHRRTPRPQLPDSLGIYLTHAPRLGRSDAERNCISNIRPQGLAYAEAARRLWWLCEAARRLGHSGLGLKDGSGPGGPALSAPQSAGDGPEV